MIVPSKSKPSKSKGLPVLREKSPLARLLRLGSLVGRVGASVTIEQLFSLVCSGPSRQLHQVANLVLNAERPYRFGYDDQLLRQVIDNNLIHFGEAKDIRFPHDIVFINRTAAGHYGNLSRLRAAAPWRRMVEARLVKSVAYTLYAHGTSMRYR